MAASVMTWAGRHERACLAAAVIAMAAMSMLVVAQPAYGLGITDLLSKGPFIFFAIFVVELMSSFMNAFLIPLSSVLFEWSTDYLSIPYVNSVIVGLQAIAIVAVVAIRVANGINSGILLRGGNHESSLGEYIYRTIAALVVVALMPLFCNLVMKLGNAIFNDVITGAGTVSDCLSWMTLGDNWDIDNIGASDDGVIKACLWAVLGALICCILTVGCGYQFVRRQVEMLVVSIVGPIVAVYYATEEDQSQVYDLLRKLFALCCIMWLQYLLVIVALKFGQAWLASATANSDVLNGLYTGDGARRFMFCLAFFMSALTVPNIVEQFAFGNGGTRVGGVAVGAVVNKAFRGPKLPIPGMGGGK